jgi:lipid-binding SYLF domain-containing protein
VAAWVALLATNFALATTAAAGIFESHDEQRAQIDADEKATLARLFEESDTARRLYESAHGYATFDIIKVSLGITGGGGHGVAVNKATGARTYMRMGTGGLNLGAGGQLYQLVFLFEDGETFDRFVNEGWEAGASANAVAGPLGANAGATFINGVAVYQLTEAGLMLQLDISGTKYWKSKLNRE